MANPFLSVSVDGPPTCPGCSKIVYPKERPLSALKAQWHPQCLKCTVCKTVLSVRSLESYQNQPYCRAHRPSPTATQKGISERVDVKVALGAPKGARKEQGIDKSSRMTFAPNTIQPSVPTPVRSSPSFPPPARPSPVVTKPEVVQENWPEEGYDQQNDQQGYDQGYNQQDQSYNQEDQSYNQQDQSYNQEDQSYNQQEVYDQQQQGYDQSYNQEDQGYNQQEDTINNKKDMINNKKDMINNKKDMTNRVTIRITISKRVKKKIEDGKNIYSTFVTMCTSFNTLYDLFYSKLECCIFLNFGLLAISTDPLPGLLNISVKRRALCGAKTLSRAIFQFSFAVFGFLNESTSITISAL